MSIQLPDLTTRIRVDSSELDRASKAGDSFGKKFGPAIATGAAVAGAAVVGFAASSVKAFLDSENASLRLDEALKKFPATNDVSRASFDKLNESLALKTKFDDDATASGQAVLAQFKLTGTQIQELTPLLQDYAAKTGKDLPTAAEDLGKAVLGQGRSLKAVGVDFKDTGTAAGNLDQITKGLRDQVGGFATAEGKTASGQAQILKNQFGELQEKVGGALVPVLQSLADKVLEVIAGFKDGTGFGGQLRDAFDKIKTSVQENEPQLRKLGEKLAEVGGFILTKVIPVVIDLAVTHVPKLVTAFEAVVTIMLNVASGSLSMVGTILGAFGSLFGALAKIPGPFQDSFKAASVAIGVAKASVDGLKVAVDIAAKPKTVKVDAETAGAKADVDNLGARIARLKDKTITITTVERIVREGQQAVGRGLQERAGGGPVYPTGSYVVGEREPELFVPRVAGRIFNQRQLAAAGAGAGGGQADGQLLAATLEQNSLLQEQNRILGRMPRDYQLGMRAGVAAQGGF